MASKGNFGQAVTYILGGIASLLVILESLLGSDAPLVEIVRKEWPVLVVAVAVGLATFGAAKLLTLLGRKIRPAFRTRSTKLKALESEIEELPGFETPTGPDALPRMSDYLWQRDQLMAKLEKLGIPTPTEEQLVILRPFLTVLYDCAIRGDVEKAKGVLDRLLPEVEAHRVAEDAAKLQELAPEIEELYRCDLNRLLEETQADDLFMFRHAPRVGRLRDELSKLGIPLPARIRDREGFSRWQTFLRDLYGYALQGNVKEAKGVLERLEPADQKPAADGNEGDSRHGGADE